ncbi:hypothetical protein BH10PSE18_BH10PSE18_09790 [soil metagenome]
MKTLRSLLGHCVLLLAAALAGCGGGTTPDSIEAKTTAEVDVPMGAVTGDVTFDSVPNSGGPLAYDAIVRKPARGVIVELVDDAQAVIAQTATDDAGRYVAQVPIGSSFTVRVVARMRQLGTRPAWDTRVADNTQLNSIYSLESEKQVATTAGVRKDLNASSGWDGNTYAGARLAAPWAILDTVYIAQQKVLSVSPTTVFPPLGLYWSPNNVPTAGDVMLGQIGTTFYTPIGVFSRIFVLGKEDVDTDEFDASVIAHEWGHYFQHAFSRDDSVGGSHGTGDLLDPRVAFSEGWGNAWSGIALARSTYTDSFGKGQAKGLSIDLAAGPIGTKAVKGWFNEQSIDQVLWHLDAEQGFGVIFDVMTSADFASGSPLTSVHAFNAALKVRSASAGSRFAPLLGAQRINAEADGWGGGETTSGGSAVALPMYQVLAVGGVVNACVSNRLGTTAGGNKLGNYAFVRFDVPVAGTYRIAVSGGGPATDPDFELYGPNGLMARAEATAPSTESLSADLKAGTHVLAVTDYNNGAANTCFVVAIS